MTEGNFFNAAPCEGIVLGHCVMIEDDAVVYGGPIKDAPNSAGKLILLHADDFERLKTVVERKRH